MYLINYAFQYLIIRADKYVFNCHFRGFFWAFAGLQTGLAPSLRSVRSAAFSESVS